MLTQKDIHINQEQASYYVDACFILSYFPGSREFDTVHDFLENIEGTIIVFSNHTFAEVVNVLFRLKLSRAIETFHRCQNKLLPGNNFSRLEQEEINRLVNISAARIAHREATKMKLNPHTNLWAYTGEIIKSIKTNAPAQRYLLSEFYRAAYTQFNFFLQDLKEEGFTIHHLSSTNSDMELAQEFMSSY